MDECDNNYDPNYDPLKQYDNTRKLYLDVVDYMNTCDIKPTTPTPIVAVYINICLKEFKGKPKSKVLHMCFKYLEKMGYNWE
jgi:hypothetical protein